MIRVRSHCISLIAAIAALSSPQLWAQSYQIPLDRGTLNYTETTQMDFCGWDVYNEYDFTNFSYTDVNGQNYSLNAPEIIILDSTGDSCGIYGDFPASEQVSGTDSNGWGYDLTLYTMDPPDLGATYQAQGTAYPQYQIQSIVYSTPGNDSNNGYSSSATNGTITSVGSSFGSGASINYTVAAGFLGVGSTIGWSYGQSENTSDNTSTTSTISQGSGVANATGGSSNAINHNQDLFVISLNPAVLITQTGSDAATYSLGTQQQPSGYPSPGSPEPQDQVEVFAQAMMSTGGATTVQIGALKPQYFDNMYLPGLAAICQDQTLYQQQLAADLADPSNPSQICTQTNQCGCVPSDFSTILAADPLLSYGTTDSPMNADASGASNCSSPPYATDCRYIPVPQPNSNDQVAQLLSGPSCDGCNRPVNSFQQSDSSETTETLTHQTSYTVGSSMKVQFQPVGSGPSLTSTTTWTWSNSESTGQINGTSNTMSVTLSSSTTDCYQNIPIYEDTVYHTFVFQQPSGDGSCP